MQQVCVAVSVKLITSMLGEFSSTMSVYGLMTLSTQRTGH